MEKIEKDFINSYYSLLIKEGEKLCEEVFEFLREDDDFMIEKSFTFCNHFIEFMEVNKLDTKYTLDLKKRCRSYIDKIKNLNKSDIL